MGDPPASAAEVQMAIDQANTASGVAKDPTVKRAIDTMIPHLRALETAAQSGDYGSEASALSSMGNDMDTVYAACTP